MPIVHLRFSAICFSDTQKARSSRMPRRTPPRATTRNSGPKSSAASDGSSRLRGASGRAALSFTHRLLTRLVDRLQKVVEDRLATGLDVDRADHAGDDRIGLAVPLQRGFRGCDPHLVVGLARFLVDQAVGGD